VVEAVACGIAVQHQIAARNVTEAPYRRIEFRVGINSGDVLVEDDDIPGDGVNVAAGLEGMAEPGATV
jgi:adenylate cyclase